MVRVWSALLASSRLVWCLLTCPQAFRGEFTVFSPLDGCFEHFGLDFLVDEDYRVWLLEANPGPDFKQVRGARALGSLAKLAGLTRSPACKEAHVPACCVATPPSKSRRPCASCLILEAASFAGCAPYLGIPLAISRSPLVSTDMYPRYLRDGVVSYVALLSTSLIWRGHCTRE